MYLLYIFIDDLGKKSAVEVQAVAVLHCVFFIS